MLYLPSIVPAASVGISVSSAVLPGFAIPDDFIVPVGGAASFPGGGRSGRSGGHAVSVNAVCGYDSRRFSPSHSRHEPPSVSRCPTSGRAGPPARRSPSGGRVHRRRHEHRVGPARLPLQRRPVEAEPPLRGAGVARGAGERLRRARRVLSLAHRDAGRARAERRAPRGRRLAAARPGGNGRHPECRWLPHARRARRACWSCTARWRPCAAIAAAASAPPPSSSRPRASPAPAAASAGRAWCCSARRCPTATLRAAWMASERAPLFLVLGSSLAVAPANLLPEAAVAAGAPLVIVNRDPTPLDRHGDAGDQRVDRGDAARRWIGCSRPLIRCCRDQEGARFRPHRRHRHVDLHGDHGAGGQARGGQPGTGLPRFSGARLRQAGGGAPHPRRPQPVRGQRRRAAAARGAGRRLAPAATRTRAPSIRRPRSPSAAAPPSCCTTRCWRRSTPATR